MATTSAQNKVIIIGGGLTGLSLGQGLKKAGIPFRIYERDSTASFRAQGYRIRIDPGGAGALKHLLPAHIWAAFEDTAAPVFPGGSRLDTKTGEDATAWRRAPPPSYGGKASRRALGTENLYNADRTVLRSVLLSGLEEYVEFNKRFERYEAVGDDEIVAHFTDGTSTSGSFLVGADGIKSLVRKQLFPDFLLLDTEGRALAGKTIVTEELKKRLAWQISQGISLSGPSEDSRLKLFCDAMIYDRETAVPSAQRIGIDLPADYIYWVLLFRKDVIGEEQEKRLLSLSTDEIAELAEQLTADWSDKLHVLFDMQTKDASSTLALSTAAMDFDTKWAEKPAGLQTLLTLIGDSAHPMTPVGGVGANTGFQDAAELFDMFCDVETSSRNKPGERERLVHAFERGILQRAKGAVERSVGGAGHFFGMKPLAELKPVSTSH